MRLLLDHREDLLQTLDLLFRLSSMLLERCLSLVELGCLGHLWKRDQDFLFGEVDVFKTFVEQLVELLRLFCHRPSPLRVAVITGHKGQRSRGRIGPTHDEAPPLFVGPLIAAEGAPKKAGWGMPGGLSADGRSAGISSDATGESRMTSAITRRSILMFSVAAAAALMTPRA